MKSIYKLSLLACLGGLSLTTQAQTSYNAGLLMENQLNGTARFMGMGGAMSALGADLSTLATNPAGIGLYRSNDVAFSLGWFQPTAKAEFNGESTDTKHSKFSFDQIGFVYSSKVGNRTAIRFLNFHTQFLTWISVIQEVDSIIKPAQYILHHFIFGISNTQIRKQWECFGQIFTDL